MKAQSRVTPSVLYKAGVAWVEYAGEESTHITLCHIEKWKSKKHRNKLSPIAINHKHNPHLSIKNVLRAMYIDVTGIEYNNAPLGEQEIREGDFFITQSGEIGYCENNELTAPEIDMKIPPGWRGVKLEKVVTDDLGSASKTFPFMREICPALEAAAKSAFESNTRVGTGFKDALDLAEEYRVLPYEALELNSENTQENILQQIEITAMYAAAGLDIDAIQKSVSTELKELFFEIFSERPDLQYRAAAILSDSKGRDQ